MPDIGRTPGPFQRLLLLTVWVLRGAPFATGMLSKSNPFRPRRKVAPAGTP